MIRKDAEIDISTRTEILSDLRDGVPFTAVAGRFGLSWRLSLNLQRRQKGVPDFTNRRLPSEVAEAFVEVFDGDGSATGIERAAHSVGLDYPGACRLINQLNEDPKPEPRPIERPVLKVRPVATLGSGKGSPLFEPASFEPVKKVHTGGRPGNMTKTKVAKILRFRRKGFSLKVIAAEVGVSSQTVDRVIKRLRQAGVNADKKNKHFPQAATVKNAVAEFVADLKK